MKKNTNLPVEDVVPGRTSIASRWHLNKFIGISLAVLTIAALYLVSRRNYPLFHSLADMATVFIAAAVFVVVWTRRHLLDNNYFLYLGISFFFFAFLDFMHLLGNKGMGVFPQYGNLGPSLYIASRYVIGISFLAAPLFIRRKLNAFFMFGAYSLATILIVLSIFYWKNFPVTYIEGVGLTLFKIASDYLICLILLASLFLLLRSRRYFDSKVMRTIAWSIVFSIATGLAFTLYSDPFGITNAMGHFFQIGSFYLAYLAFVDTVLTKPQDILYRSLNQSNEEAHALNNELERANFHLKQNIAERKKAEETLEQLNRELETKTVELKASNKELEAFTYSVSHDLRAPLRAIDGFSNALREDYADTLDAKGRRYLDIISSNAQKMGNLITDLLTFSRLSRQALNVIPVDMKALAHEVCTEQSTANPVFDHVCAVREMPQAIGDPALLRQVLVNLVSNAIKFTRPKKQKVIELEGRVQGNENIYWVKDNGVGFDMRYYGKMFGVFQRLHRDEDFEGTGVGLAIVQRIVHRHGGRIWAESKLDEGATFYFTLPAKQQSREQDHNESPSQ